MKEMKKLRVSFGMDDETTLSSKHFGDSLFFLIYDIYENGNFEFIEKRWNSSTIENEHGDINKFRSIVSLLSDVDVLVAYRMGPNFLNIKNNSNKIPFLTRDKNFQRSLELVIKNFDKLYDEKEMKSK